jgi:hypothetical protein
MACTSCGVEESPEILTSEQLWLPLGSGLLLRSLLLLLGGCLQIDFQSQPSEHFGVGKTTVKFGFALIPSLGPRHPGRESSRMADIVWPGHRSIAIQDSGEVFSIAWCISKSELMGTIKNNLTISRRLIRNSKGNSLL